MSSEQMNKIDDGGPAFVTTGKDFMYFGLSKRDWFAGQALSGWSESHHSIAFQMTDPEYATRMARTAYEIADAMLKVRATQ